jgi:hypothetical protein
MFDIRLMVGDMVESNEDYDKVFNRHINKTKIIEFTYYYPKSNLEHIDIIAILENGHEINIDWLKRAI